MSINFSITIMNKEGLVFFLPEITTLTEEKSFIPFTDVKKEINEIVYEKLKEINHLTDLDRTDYDLRITNIRFIYAGPTIEYIMNREGTQTIDDLKNREFLYGDGDIFLHRAGEELKNIDTIVNYVLYR